MPDQSEAKSSLFDARHRVLCWHRAPGLFWFRVFGKGFHIRDTTRHPLRFSERNGYSPMWTIRRLR